MQEDARLPNPKRLRAIVAGASLIALIWGAVFYLQIRQDADMNWIWWLMIGTLTMMMYGTAFYFGVLMFENTLEKYIVSDDITPKRDGYLEIETETRPAESKSLDVWVSHYVFARRMFGVGLLPMIACVYLFFFAV